MYRARESNLLGKITVVVVICCCSLPVQGKYGGGTGGPNDPYLIYTPEQMNAIGADANDWDKCFKLMADIDLSGYTGTSFNIIGYWVSHGSPDNKPFTGVFDGNGHTISNFTYTSTGTHNIGLFGCVGGWGENAEIKDLGLIAPDVDAPTGRWVGSLVGWLIRGTITACYADGATVAGDGLVGGLVGGNSSGTISYSYVTASVTGELLVGGLVGDNRRTITNCYSEGDVSGGSRVGGLVGRNEGTITNCYSASSVTGGYSVGGLVAWTDGTITNCYSTGRVSGNDDVGGLVGYNNYGTYTKCFWDNTVNSELPGIGNTTDPNVIGESTTNMQIEKTFTDAGWDFNTPVWTIDEGVDYPRLWWEAKYGGGSGTANDPYLIYTAEHMNAIGADSNDWDKHFLLCADINLSAFTGTSFNIIGSSRSKAFTGVFYGDNHTISNFTYDSIDAGHLGIFGFVGNFQIDGEINNLGLIGPDVNTVKGHYVGSLVGHLIDGKITNCYVEGGSVTGDAEVGGLVGDNYKGRITNCYSTCSIAGNKYVGGLVGHSYEGTITNCYSTGSVAGNKYVGGLMGFSHEGTITNCYSTGSVTGTTYVGGLLGKSSGHVVSSYWDIETSGQITSDGGTGKTTAEMQTMTTFTDAGWDFVGETANGTDDIWFIPQQDYPHLWWEGMQVPMKLTPRTLNCRSYGNWVKAHITLPEGFTVADVDPDRPAVLHSLGFESAPLYVFVNKDKLVEIEAAFEREAVCSLAGDWPQALTVAGFLTDGNIFLGTSTVRIIHPGMKVIEELASCWLQGDCVHPTWCDRIDMNRDSLVNLLDYALLMNIEVEFVTDE